MVATPDDKDSSLWLHSVFFLPFFHICDVQLNCLIVRFVPFEEVVESLRVDRLGLGWSWTDYVVVTSILQPAVLLLTKRGHVFELFLSLLDLIPGLVMHSFLSLNLRLFLLLLFSHLILDRIELPFLSLADRLRPGLTVSGLLEDLMFPFLIKGELLFHIQTGSLGHYRGTTTSVDFGS